MKRCYRESDELLEHTVITTRNKNWVKGIRRILAIKDLAGD